MSIHNRQSVCVDSYQHEYTHVPVYKYISVPDSVDAAGAR